MIYITCHLKDKKSLSYEDVTSEMLKQANDNPIMPKFIKELYIYDRQGNVVNIYTEKNATFRKKNSKEDETATIKRLKTKLGWNMSRLREVETPEGIRTPDLKRFINDGFEYWDIKNVGKSETPNSKTKKISRAFEESLGQTRKIVIDLNRKDCDLTNEEAIQQLDLAFNNKKFISIDNVILLGKDELIKNYQRK